MHRTLVGLQTSHSRTTRHHVDILAYASYNDVYRRIVSCVLRSPLDTMTVIVYGSLDDVKLNQ